MKEYFVVVTEPQYKEQIHQELLATHGVDPIPDRPVMCHDDMPFSEYNGMFLLTDEEAEKLKTDPRVSDVHLSYQEMGGGIKHCGTRTGQYDKRGSTTAVTSNMKNWGLARCISARENFGVGVQTADTYTYNLDGSGVDVIIMDTGVDAGHPEFAVNADGTGGSRVVDYDWTQLGAITSVPTGGFLGDCNGHGSNCASIAAGNTNGWAPGAAIYTLRVVPSTGGIEHDITTGAVLGLVNESKAWQSVRLFHQAKSIDPTTGYKRPTIVSASYQYYSTYNNMQSITYRGVTHATNTTDGAYGAIGVPEGNSTGDHGLRYSVIEADISSAIAAGVVVVAAAGNDAHKIDVSTGLDYNNYWTDIGNTIHYYHRGGTPGAADGVICAGAISDTLPEHKISFSSTGPRVDVFGPGSFIMGADSSAARTFASIPDPRNSSYYLNKLSGTSQATPQVAGICALLLQLRPGMTPADVRSWIKGTAVKNLLSETYYGQTGIYTNFASLQGAVNGILYMPFNLPNPLNIT
jgi:subtilisin family serine protease